MLDIAVEVHIFQGLFSWKNVNLSDISFFHDFNFQNNVMPCPSTGRKMFCASPNFLSQSRNLIAFIASSKTFLPAQKPNLLNGNHLLVRHKIFGTDTKCTQIFSLAHTQWPKYF
jgi:hypothetical protein